MSFSIANEHPKNCAGGSWLCPQAEFLAAPNPGAKKRPRLDYGRLLQDYGPENSSQSTKLSFMINPFFSHLAE
jgi:hypothetical protein